MCRPPILIVEIFTWWKTGAIDCMLIIYPQNAVINTTAISIHNDPRLWEKPETLLPERWLDEDGKFTTKKEGFLPFGVGAYWGCRRWNVVFIVTLARVKLVTFIFYICFKFNCFSENLTPVVLTQVSEPASESLWPAWNSSSSPQQCFRVWASPRRQDRPWISQLIPQWPFSTPRGSKTSASLFAKCMSVTLFHLTE